MIIKSVRVLSLSKILAAIYGGLGLIFGAILAAVSLFGGGPLAGPEDPAFLGVLLGGGAVIALPLFYGIMGFVAGLIVGTIYNFVAGLVGGLELEVG